MIKVSNGVEDSIKSMTNLRVRMPDEADAVANLSGSSGSTGPPARPSGSTEPPIATSAGPSSSSSGTSFSSPPQVFLSYNWDIQLKVAQLKERLEQRGITCWMDRPNVGLGDELRGTIAHGITNCKMPTSPRCLLTFVDSECHGRLQKLDSSLSFLLGADAVANLSGSSGSTGPPARPSGSTEPPIATSAGPSSSSSGTSFSSPPQVFLSYNWDIQLKVAQLKERLEQRGITCWMDRPNVGLGDELRGTIAHGITNCKVFISCLTKKYCYSDMCQREAKLASERKKHIVPLLFEDLGSWPPQGSLALVFTDTLYLKLPDGVLTDIKFEELLKKIEEVVYS
ncbi:uncharacterized protein LOC111321767 [Stylophora pistillata]|uniref:uncharacterized protein LOC111321767 n=1 Tax=Stylophora pistillata TaxID=50429 RepID=UPI000C039A7B|nr:uncharacterized protein LOC111321767 [Stylophora pistillata]